MLTSVRHFLSLIRFSHTVFALPFALLAAMMAWRLAAASLSFPSSWRLAEKFGRPMHA